MRCSTLRGGRVEVVASLSQGRTAAAQCGLFTYKSVPVIFEPPCRYKCNTEVHSHNHYCCGKAVSTTHSECMYVILVTQPAKRMRRRTMGC